MMLQDSAIAMKPARRGPARLLGGVLSLPYLLLRSSTAGAAVVAGLVQTFVFARVLSPENFSIYILVGAFGVSLWLFDLGAAKILFIRQRARHIAQREDGPEPAQASAIVTLYTLVVALGTLLCFAVMALRPSASSRFIISPIWWCRLHSDSAHPPSSSTPCSRYFVAPR